MNALTFQSKGNLRYKTVPDPSIQSPSDAIVEVQLAAICGSDLHVYHGREKGLDPGTVMGHEFVGQIIETGTAVTRLKVGDRVIGPFTTNCGRCFYCRHGLTCRCTRGQLFGWVVNGVGLQGTQADYLRVPLADATLVALPDEVDPEEGLLLGDVFSTGYFAADLAQVREEGVYVVLGCGPVGLLTVVAARALGARRIYAVDAVPERLALAEQFGATAIDFHQQNAVDIVKQATEGRGADAVLEAVGNAAATRMALDLLRPGGTLSAVGVHTEPHVPFSPAEAYDLNLTYRTGRCPARAYMDRLVPIVEQKKPELRSIITHRMPLSEAVRAYEIFDQKLEGCIKVVLIP